MAWDSMELLGSDLIILIAQTIGINIDGLGCWMGNVFEMK